MPGLASSPVSGRQTVWRGAPRADTTLQRMKAIVQEEYQNPVLVEAAVGIVVHAPEKNDRAAAQAIMSWMREHTHYVADPINEQLIKTPLLMLALIRRDNIAGGDCVDIAMLSACLALDVGLLVRFVAEGYAGDEVHAELVHVYTIVQTGPGEWFNFDTQRTPAEGNTHPVRRVEVDIID